jgi:pyruvate dehydrogenase E2 component (dihydrolipoamide acetyltransferase)
MVTEFRLPEVGEHIENATVVRVLVEPGQVIKKEETIMELETDKATLEVPSAVAGRVKEVKVKPGETIKVGAVILTVEEDTGEETGPTVREVPAGEKPAEAPTPEAVHAEIKREQTLEQTTPVEPTEAEVEEEIKPAIAAATPPVTPAPEPPCVFCRWPVRRRVPVGDADDVDCDKCGRYRLGRNADAVMNALGDARTRWLPAIAKANARGFRLSIPAGMLISLEESDSSGAPPA